MTVDKTIFGLRFGMNDDLYPTSEELRAFLESPKSKGEQKLHSADLETYDAMLEEIESFEHSDGQIAETRDFREQVYYGVLIHTRLFNHALKSAVEQYKFHLHALRELDFAKPAAFVRSAADELSRLNPKRKDDAAKLARLQGLVDERKKMLESQKGRWVVLAKELNHIAVYIRDNLAKIQRISETSISVLKDPRTRYDVERMVTEDIKAQFKEQLKDALHRGPVTRAYLEAVKKDVDALLKEVCVVLQKDMDTLRVLYGAVRDHTRKAVQGIDNLTVKIRNASMAEDRELLMQLEKVLLALINDCRFGLKAAAIATEIPYKNILVEKRNAVLEHLLNLLQRERRAWSDRRSSRDRRKFNEPEGSRAERRRGKNRRSGKDRRT
jgi:hypothetical protein